MSSKTIRVVLTAACIGLIFAAHSTIHSTQLATNASSSTEQGQSADDLMTHSGYMVAVG